MVWDCPSLIQAWVQVMERISAVVDMPLVPDPLLCLLGITMRTKKTKCYMKIFDLALILFKCLIAMAWVAAVAPDVNCWLRVVHKWAVAEADTMLRDQQLRGDKGVATLWDTCY